MNINKDSNNNNNDNTNNNNSHHHHPNQFLKIENCLVIDRVNNKVASDLINWDLNNQDLNIRITDIQLIRFKNLGVF